jgi:hypothetical protein
MEDDADKCEWIGAESQAERFPLLSEPMCSL